VAAALLAVARNEDSRKCLILLGEILDVPELCDRLLQVLRPAEVAEPAPKPKVKRAGKGTKP
jgi:hypothetical protein